jgi:SPP1 gp7 family putative phage head morphogenesis protein
LSTNRDKAWAGAHKAETQYAQKLRQVAKHIQHIVAAFPDTGAESLAAMQMVLRDYSKALTPWAHATARRMLWDVSRRNEQAWADLSRTMGQQLRKEIQTAPTGVAMQELMKIQVGLITSLPLEAAQRVQDMAIASLTEGTRGGNLIQEIMRSGAVSRSRAICIARTETARATSVLTQARAMHVGSDSYIWRTIRDANVRDSHQEMEGRVCSWANPPIVEKGKPPYHAGCIYNCRCYPEPIIPDKFL